MSIYKEQLFWSIIAISGHLRLLNELLARTILLVAFPTPNFIIAVANNAPYIDKTCAPYMNCHLA
jgi:hypothetical protein